MKSIITLLIIGFLYYNYNGQINLLQSATQELPKNISRLYKLTARFKIIKMDYIELDEQRKQHHLLGVDNLSKIDFNYTQKQILIAPIKLENNNQMIEIIRRAYNYEGNEIVLKNLNLLHNSLTLYIVSNPSTSVYKFMLLKDFLLLP